MRLRFILLTLMLFVVLCAACQKQEEITQLSSEQVVKIIGDYIKEKIGEEESFTFEDKQENYIRELEYVKIYEPVQKTEKGEYYTCVDFIDGEDRLDIDFYVSKKTGEHKVSDVVIHMVNGKSRP